MSEHKLQVAVAKLLDASGLLWTAIPNGGKRSAVTGAILKAEGVKRGVPDVAVLEPYLVKVEVPMTKARFFTLQDCIDGKQTVIENRVKAGLFIELKDGTKGRLSSYQQAWIERLQENGYRAEVCRNIDDVLRVLKECYPHRFA